jgi:hypothetical protein
MLHEVSKTIEFERLQCWCACWEGFMKHPVEVGVRWRDVHTEFREDGSDIPVIITSTVLEAAVLVLLMGLGGGDFISMPLNGLKWHDIHVKLDRFRRSKVGRR